jgi:SAM-dependent methyltransferase
VHSEPYDYKPVEVFVVKRQRANCAFDKACAWLAGKLGAALASLGTQPRFTMAGKKHLDIVASCETDLETHGDTFLGAGWTKKKEYADLRYQVMLDVIDPKAQGRISLLDFGCGASHLYEYILRLGLKRIDYSGLDLSEKYLALARRKFPEVVYYHCDVLDCSTELPRFDYVVLNGIFNYKGDQSFDEMYAYFEALIARVYPQARVGIAFNVMSKQVDWERDDLFHLPMDLMASFLAKKISRKFTIRHDYGLYEYTTYVYR